jgi:hypothetical protein
MSLQKQGLSSDLDERGLRLEDLRDVDTDQRPDKKLNLAIGGTPIHPYRSQASAVCYWFFSYTASITLRRTELDILP